jgi:hypothetical protein
VALAHPTKSQLEGDTAADFRSRVILGSQPTGGGSQALRGLEPVLELGGTPLYTLLTALWYRVHLERLFAAQTLAETSPGLTPPLSQTTPSTVAFVLEGERTGLVGQRSAPPAGTEQATSWATLVEAYWPMAATDLQYAAYAACFPPPPRHRDALATGIAPTTTMSTGTASSVAHGSDPDEIALATSQSDRKWWEEADEEADKQRTLEARALWDPSDPFATQARWLASGFTPKVSGIAHEASDIWRNPGRAGGLGARGRMPCMRWCMETTAAASACIGAEPAVTAEFGLTTELLPKGLASASPWAYALAQACYERLVVACKGAAASGFLPAAVADAVAIELKDSPVFEAPHAEAAAAAASSAATDGADAHTASAPSTDSQQPADPAAGQFARDVLGLMHGLPGVQATSWRLPPSESLPKDQDVSAWANQLTAHRGYVGWDSILALASWDLVEEPYPLNCCALIDREPQHELREPDDDDDDDNDDDDTAAFASSGMRGPMPSAPTPTDLQSLPGTDCKRPARLVALLMVLAQAVPDSSASSLCNWILAAKQTYATAVRRYQDMLTRLKKGGTEAQRHLVMRSAVLWALYSNRAAAANCRVSFAALATACAPGAVDQFALYTAPEFHEQFERVDDPRWALQNTAPSVAMFARALHLLGGGMTDAIAACKALVGLE